MRVLPDFSKEVINIIKEIGIVVDEEDEYGNPISFYYLPIWFKDVNGHIFECTFDELPDIAKEVHRLYINQK